MAEPLCLKLLPKPRHSKSGRWCCVYCSCDLEQKQKRKGGKSPCGLHPALQGPPQGKHYIQYSCFPPLLNWLQRLVQKLERTGIDLTSDGSGIDNWTLRNALLSRSALKISTVHPLWRGCCSIQASVECLKRSLLTWFKSVWHHAIPQFSHRESFTSAWIGWIWLITESLHSSR